VLEAGGKQYLLGVKLDLEQDLIRDWRRPMYTYESGKTTYGDFETDGQFLSCVESTDSISYLVTGATKILHKGGVLHEQPPSLSALNFDGSPDQPGVSRLRRWEAAFGKR
jgi:hypothetical protein